MEEKVTIRGIEDKDNADIENLIRSCLIEFNANHDGTAWADPFLGQLSKVYDSDGNSYWVAVNAEGKIVAGAGIGKIEGVKDICELQKMYCLPEARGTGIADQLMHVALEYAKSYYRRCYLETLENMVAAQKFYEKHGFKRIYDPVVKTAHFSCDVRYLKDL
jgi:putative acetyltransferase